MSFCGCDPNGSCACIFILMALAPPEGFTQDLTMHQQMAVCGPGTNLPDANEDLYALADSNHHWWNGSDESGPDVAAPISRRLEGVVEVCRDCKLLRTTTRIPRMMRVMRDTILDVGIGNPTTMDVAAWLHDQANDRLLPCSPAQYEFATRHTLDCEEEYSW